MPRYILETSQEKATVSILRDDGSIKPIPAEGALNLLNYASSRLYYMAGYRGINCVVPFGDDRDLEPWEVWQPEAPAVGSDCPRCGQKIREDSQQEKKIEHKWDDGLKPGEMIF